MGVKGLSLIFFLVKVLQFQQQLLSCGNQYPGGDGENFHPISPILWFPTYTAMLLATVVSYWGQSPNPLRKP